MLLVTSRLLPEGEPGGDLVAALDTVGVDAAWAVWDDETVDWACDLVAVRTTWDYTRRPAEFLAWARRVERISPLLNGAETFTWNADKSYLLGLAEHVPTVPTVLLDESTLVEGLVAGLAAHDTVVVKPRTGAGGRGLVVVSSLTDEALAGLSTGPWVLQPLVESVRTTGETSVFVLGGRAVSQVDKRPAAGEVRVHEQYGGRSRSVPRGEPTTSLATDAVRAAGRVLGTAPSYARVDMMELGGRWVVGELELIEPGLYLDVEPLNALRFATLVAEVLAGFPARR